MKRPVLLFDLDGTLTDPSAGILRCIADTLHTFGCVIPPREELARFIGPPLQDTFATLVPDHGPEAVARFRDAYGTTGLYENQVYEGMIDALQGLAAITQSMFVATSKPGEYAVRIIRHFDMDRFFRGVYGSGMNGERADKTELVGALLAEEGLDPVEVTMIGDRKHDIVAARAHGLRSIGVTWGFGTANELREAGADVLCNAPSELVTALG